MVSFSSWSVRFPASLCCQRPWNRSKTHGRGAANASFYELFRNRTPRARTLRQSTLFCLQWTPPCSASQTFFVRRKIRANAVNPHLRGNIRVALASWRPFAARSRHHAAYVNSIETDDFSHPSNICIFPSLRRRRLRTSSNQSTAAFQKSTFAYITLTVSTQHCGRVASPAEVIH